MLLAELTDQVEYRKAIEQFCDYNLHFQKKTPRGLLYIEKSGTLSHAANIVFLCLQVPFQLMAIYVLIIINIHFNIVV